MSNKWKKRANARKQALGEEAKPTKSENYIVVYGPGTAQAFQAAATRDGKTFKEYTDFFCGQFRSNYYGRLDKCAVSPQITDPNDTNLALQMSFMGSCDVVFCSLVDLHEIGFNRAEFEALQQRVRDAVGPCQARS